MARSCPTGGVLRKREGEYIIGFTLEGKFPSLWSPGKKKRKDAGREENDLERALRVQFQLQKEVSWEGNPLADPEEPGLPRRSRFVSCDRNKSRTTSNEKTLTVRRVGSCEGGLVGGTWANCQS